ncbi:hypothetical protein MGYG_05454 [Nannizzia gypsea CBS 118893]|uniref:Uncharacterized protein n=1 Tax=Arthroderma gypseum (strain ATCC MYA-4604 / CBS 118893) TaxID=535722 RepID=E4UW13_ARTGP|nr:hypothetical protein MGYG_05454 [Nannizzia gypsea CBS 118893]EFR02461.1 hypothetical protein MGYG_05454 [Nannizzia gypsea CBS 118893]
MEKMPAVRRYLTAEKTALIMQWVDKVNSQPCIGMKPREPNKIAEPKDITLPAAAPAKTAAEKGQPPKYKQLTLKSTRLRRVRVISRGSRQDDGQTNEKVEAVAKEEERKEEHVKETKRVAQTEKGYGEEKRDKEVKKEIRKQALPSNPMMSSVIASNLRMFCVEIVVPSSEKKQQASQEKQACGDSNRADSEKRKRRGGTRARGGRAKCPKLAIEKG